MSRLVVVTIPVRIAAQFVIEKVILVELHFRRSLIVNPNRNHVTLSLPFALSGMVRGGGWAHLPCLASLGNLTVSQTRAVALGGCGRITTSGARAQNIICHRGAFEWLKPHQPALLKRAQVGVWRWTAAQKSSLQPADPSLTEVGTVTPSDLENCADDQTSQVAQFRSGINQRHEEVLRGDIIQSPKLNELDLLQALRPRWNLRLADKLMKVRLGVMIAGCIMDGDVHLEFLQIRATRSKFSTEGHIEVPIVAQAQLPKVFAMGLHERQKILGVDSVAIRKTERSDRLG